MKCCVEGCDAGAVTFHGVSAITHGYCAEHRCCAKCGLLINYGCKCEKPTERDKMGRGSLTVMQWYDESIIKHEYKFIQFISVFKQIVKKLKKRKAFGKLEHSTK